MISLFSILVSMQFLSLNRLDLYCDILSSCIQECILSEMEVCINFGLSMSCVVDDCQRSSRFDFD